MIEEQYTKESIRNRMFRRAATLWNVRVDSLDPVVKLLIEALASEVFKLGGEIESMESRILDRLAAAFTPSYMASALPAHAVLHVRAVSGEAEVDPETEFAYKNAVFMKRHHLRRLVFSPVCKAKVIAGDAVHLISRGHFYNLTPAGGKDHDARSVRRDPAFNGKLWLAIETAGDEPVSLANTSLYFDFPLMEDSAEYFRILEHIRVYAGGKPVRTLHGLADTGDGDGNFFQKYDHLRQISGNILAAYRNRFLTLDGDVPAERATFPAELRELFPKEFVDSHTVPLLWLMLELPPAFTERVQEYMEVYINCLPVANRLTVTLTQILSTVSSIVPLKKDDNEYFLSVMSVFDSLNRPYLQVRTHGENTDTGVYTLRRGGTERFDRVDARDALERLTDLLRDEAAAFSGVNRTMLEQMAGDLLANLNSLGQKSDLRSDRCEPPSYLTVSKGEDGDAGDDDRTGLTVKYCLTNGEAGNGLRAGEVMNESGSADIIPSSCILMTPTIGGARAQTAGERTFAFKYLLAAGGRIYTRDDIVSYCRGFFGNLFTGVRVKEGYEPSLRPKEGIIRTTEIWLEGVNGKEDRETLERDMAGGLLANSPEGMNYRIRFESSVKQ
jgi:hypothetical protein